MKINKNDIQTLANNLSVELTEELDSFNFQIDKIEHSFEVLILKNGQYIFTTLKVENREYPIEHIEFYMNETKNEIIEKLRVNVYELSNYKSRVAVKKNWFGTKLRAELLKENKWEPYGYPGNQTKRKDDT